MIEVTPRGGRSMAWVGVTGRNRIDAVRDSGAALSSNLVCASFFSSTKWAQCLSHRCVVRLKQVNVLGELKTVVTRSIVCFIEILIVLTIVFFFPVGTSVYFREKGLKAYICPVGSWGLQLLIWPLGYGTCLQQRQPCPRVPPQSS